MQKSGIDKYSTSFPPPILFSDFLITPQTRTHLSTLNLLIQLSPLQLHPKNPMSSHASEHPNTKPMPTPTSPMPIPPLAPPTQAPISKKPFPLPPPPQHFPPPPQPRSLAPNVNKPLPPLPKEESDTTLSFLSFHRFSCTLDTKRWQR